MKKYFLSIILCSFYLVTNAQNDFLEPATGFFSSYYHQDEYYPRVKKILYDSLKYNPNARIIVMPSFSEEYLVSIDTKNRETYLTYRIAKNQIWSNKTKENIECTEYKMKIDYSIAKILHNLIFTATSKAKYPDQPIPKLDGTTYIFIAFETGYGFRSGMTWSPGSGKLHELTEIVDWLVDCAKKGELISQDKMQKKINDLIERFKI